jgi:predicted RNA binding protein YcfA (HicA-like mRNA interferase family)
MTRLRRGISAREFVKALQADGFVLQRTRGSHRIFRNSKGRRVLVAYHHLSDTFPVGTLYGMVKDAGWTDEEIKRLGLLG